MWSNKKIWQTIIYFTGLFQCMKGAYIRCYKGSLTEYDVIPIENPLELLNSSCIDRSLRTVVYTFGYQGKVDGPITKIMISAYLDYGKVNVLLLDWEREANSKMLGIQLGYVLYAIPNAMKVGRIFGNGLAQLARAGLAITHLVGHSLGAHLMGFAGRAARSVGFLILEITGLDPAGPVFDSLFFLPDGLDTTCAKFVAIIHTDPRTYGTNRTRGTVDIWPNPNGDKQPGCPDGNFAQFSESDLCSHNQACLLYAEGLSNPTNLEASGALNYEQWAAVNGQTNDTLYIREMIRRDARGNYFLSTNGESPYGRGEQGTMPDTREKR